MTTHDSFLEMLDQIALGVSTEKLKKEYPELQKEIDLMTETKQVFNQIDGHIKVPNSNLQAITKSHFSFFQEGWGYFITSLQSLFSKSAYRLAPLVVLISMVSFFTWNMNSTENSWNVAEKIIAQEGRNDMILMEDFLSDEELLVLLLELLSDDHERVVALSFLKNS